MSNRLAVGIDLGTTNTCVACYIDGDLKVLENKEGNYITSSYVFFHGRDEIVVGDLARKFSATNPEHGLYEMKRFIGRQYDEIVSRQDISKFSFLLKDVKNSPQIFLREFNIFQSPVEICTLILTKIKRDICEKFGENITKAVITVPAHFNLSQRKATLECARTSGFEVLKLLSEPTAAALNYFYEIRHATSKYYVVYDLGGGTFDVAVIKKHQDKADIVCINGDSYLGGRDFDDLITEHILDEIHNRYETKGELDKRQMRRLRNESEKCKERLSSCKETQITIDGFLGQKTIELALTRVHFEKMASPLIQRSIDVLDACLKNSGLKKSDIVGVILAGGSTRIPKIRKMLKTYFNGKSTIKVLHPEECVAKGAALQAAMLSEDPRQTIQRFRVREVTSSSLGVADVVQKMDFIIKKDTPLPVCKSVTHATVVDRQSAMHLKIYEGEKWDVNKNKYLGELRITELTPSPPGRCKITVTMNIDVNGILTVTASEKYKDNVKDLQIVIIQDLVKKGCLATDEDDEQGFVEFAELKKNLIRYCAAVLYNLHGKNLTVSHKPIYERCVQIQQEVYNMCPSDSKLLKKLLEELQNECVPLIKRHNFTEIPTDGSVNGV